MSIENNIGNVKPQKEIPRRLWLANEISLKLVVKDINITGKENIKEIPMGAKVIVMTTHLTDFDVPIAIHSVAKELDIVVMNESVHHHLFGKQGEASTNLGMRIAGTKNFLSIDYRKNESGKKSPKAFNSENFEPAVKAMEEGRAVMMAAHNPSQEPRQNLDDVKGGYGGVYLAELTDAYILPVTIVLDRATGMYEPNFGALKNLKGKPNASVVIGKPFQLEKIVGIERFSELTKKEDKLTEEEHVEFSRLAKALREQSAVVMKKLSEQLAKKD